MSYLKNANFLSLELCYLNYTCSKKKTDQNVSLQKVSTIIFLDNCKYVSASKSYMLQSHITPSGDKSVIFPSIPHACMLLKFIHFTVPGQNIVCTSVSSKSGYLQYCKE